MLEKEIGEIMKVLLAAVNAKYIHSNLAVHSLKSICANLYGRNRSCGIYDQSDRRSDPDGSVPQKAGYALLFLLSLEYRICRTFTAGDPEDPAEDGNLARRTGSVL